jgi:AcrR family transcriptional regulator
MEKAEHTDVARVAAAVSSGRLKLEALSARRLAAFLGKTTGSLYHHHGSIDVFLFAVAQAGYRKLGERLLAEAPRGLAEVAAAFVAFGLDNPAFYTLMFEHRYDWAALRKAGAVEGNHTGLDMWRALVEQLRRSGAADPEGDARLLFAGLHGLVSLAASGRANIGDLGRSDRDVAVSSARALAQRLAPRERNRS